MWADNRMEIIRKMRGQVVPEKSRGCKNRYVVNCICPGMEMCAV